MAQTYVSVTGSDTLASSRPKLTDRDEALRSSFSGPTAPASPVEGQWWRDTTNGITMHRTPGGWVQVPIGVPVPLAQGGTGATDQAGARTNFGLGSLATLSSVGTGQIADGAITLAKYADNSISDAKLIAGSVTGPKLASGAAITNLGFTPIQQGTGAGQNGTTIKMGSDGAGNVKLDVGGSDLGAIALASQLTSYMPKSGGAFSGAITRTSQGAYVHHQNADFTSAAITVSGSAPSGGANGDIWFQTA